MREAKLQFDLYEKTDAAMYAILLQNDLHGLKHLYEGTYKNMYSWSLALEYEQRIIRYEKYFANNAAPMYWKKQAPSCWICSKSSRLIRLFRKQ